MKRSALVLFFGALGAALGWAAPVNIVVVTLDTTRADRMGFLGSKQGLTPNLDDLAKDSVVFTRAYAQVPLTTPSHATILTGTYPQLNQMSDMGNALGKDVPYLPDIVHRQGYASAAFVGSQVLDPSGVGAPGFARGFDLYDAPFHSRGSGEDRYQSVERRAGVVVDRAIGWLAKNTKGPFFLWVHLYDPHDPYDPPEPFKTRYASQPYDGEVAYMDSAIGRLLSTLRARGLYAKTVIAVMADHGESLGDHGESTHGIFLYDETVHVPLMVKLVSQSQAGTVIRSRVGLVDVAPTILQLAGIGIPAAMQGIGLLSSKTANSSRSERDRLVAERACYAESDYPYRAFGWSPLRSLRSGKYLYIQAPRPELYDQEVDLAAAHNLASDAKAVSDTMSNQLQQFRQKTSGMVTTPRDIPPEQAEQLQALGYVATVHRSNIADVRNAPDPKDKIEIANSMHEALLAVEEDRDNDAMGPLKRVLRDQPDSELANIETGKALNRLKNFSEAVPYLEKAVQLAPQSGRAHFELGRALLETGDITRSVYELEAALSSVADSPDVHFSLAMGYEKLGRDLEAAREYNKTLQLNPEHFLANLMLGRMLGMSNQPRQALPYLEAAVRLNPHSTDAHKFLANVYTELGQLDKAQREREEADQQSDH